MAKLLEILRFLPNKGINLNKPEEFLKNNISVDGTINMEYYNELFQGRLGMSKFDTTVLSGPITLIDQFWLDTGSWYLIFCTTKDIYKYDFTNTRFDILTPTYTTGIITIDTGSATTVTGSGTSWESELAEGDYIKIGTGNIHTDATWYEIESVDSDTQLTLTSDAAGCADSGYVARKIFQGTATDFWNSVVFEDDILGKLWITTNGVDTPIRWTGTGQVANIATLPTDFTTAKYVNVYKDRLFFFWCVVDGANLPRTGYWSAVANCEDWDDLEFIDFFDEDYWITGVTNFADYQIVFRERDAMIGRYVGGDYTFDWEKSSTCGGCWSPFSIITTQHFMYYFGPDNKFHSWNLLREDDIFGDELLSFMKDLDPDTQQYIFGWEVEEKNQIRWFIPYGDIDYHNYIFVYDYEQNVPNLWPIAYAQSLWSMGEYLNVANLYLDDPLWGEYYLDTQEGFWDDRMFLSGAPIIIYGGYDGYVRIADNGITDDGTSYTRRFRSIRDNFGLPQRNKRLYKQQFWFEQELSGSVTVSLKKGDKNDFETSTKTISLVNTTKDKIKKDITWDKNAQNFQTQIEATVHFSLLGFINKVYPKKETF